MASSGDTGANGMDASPTLAVGTFLPPRGPWLLLLGQVTPPEDALGLLPHLTAPVPGARISGLELQPALGDRLLLETPSVPLASLSAFGEDSGGVQRAALVSPRLL